MTESQQPASQGGVSASSAGTYILGGGGAPTDRRVLAELTDNGLQVTISARLTYGSQGRRTSATLNANLTSEQETQLTTLLEEIAQANRPRVANRLSYDVGLAHRAAIEAGEEAAPELN